MADINVGELLFMRDTQARLLADPELTGQTLLFALALLQYLVYRDVEGEAQRRKTDPEWWPKRWIHEIDAMVNGRRVPTLAERTQLHMDAQTEQAWAHTQAGWPVAGTPAVRPVKALNPAEFTNSEWVRSVLAADFPRYEPPVQWGRRCVASMKRRPGLCGKSSSNWWVDRDPETGHQRHLALCSRHNTPQEKAPWDARLAAWRDNGSPVPAVNSGGVLAAHFSGNWDELYQWASPWRTRNDNREPERPRLRLIPDLPDTDEE